MTTIDLGECETLLRTEYNIFFNEPLYIKNIDIKQIYSTEKENISKNEK